MVGTLSPILSQGVAPEQAVSAPSTGSAVAGLIGGFLGAVPTQKAAPKPTQKESFAQDWKLFSDKVGVQLDPSNPDYRKNLRRYGPMFMSQFPEHSSEFSTMFKSFGYEGEDIVDTSTKIEQAQEDAFVVWSSSPSGILADATARQAATVGGNFHEGKYKAAVNAAYAADLAMQVKLKEVSEQSALNAGTKSSLETKQAVSKDYWNTFKPAARNQANASVATLNEVFQTVRVNGSAAVPEELSGMLGGIQEITPDNFNAVAGLYREVLKDQIRVDLISKGELEPGALTNPSEDYWDSVFVVYDTIVGTAEKDWGSMSAILETMQSGAMREALTRLEEDVPGVSISLKVVEALQRALGRDSVVFGEVMENAGVLELYQTLASNTLSALEVGDLYGEQSKKDREGLSRSALTDLGTGKAAGEPLESKYELVRKGVPSGSHYGMNTFRSVFGKNRKNLSAQADLNPEFKTTLSKDLLNDINLSINSAALSLPSSNFGTFVVTEEGKLDFMVDMGAVRASEGFVDPVEAALDIKETMTTNQAFIDINNKLLIVNDMGETGQDVLKALQVRHPESAVNAEFFDAETADPYAAYYTPDPFSDSYVGGGPEGLIAKREGLRLKAYWDVNHWRTGYGSDTVTLEDGTVKKTTENTVITEADARRDLERREKLSAQSAARKVGREVWNSLPLNVTEPLTSITYNYGSLPDRLVSAVKSGNIEAIAKAVEGLAGDNKGVNRGRRMEEAAMIRGLTAVSGRSPQAPAVTPRPQDRPEFVDAGSSSPASTPTTSTGIAAQPQSTATSASPEAAGGGGTKEVSEASKKQAQRVYTQLADQTKSFLLRLFGSEEEILNAIAAGEISEEDL